MQSTSSSSRSDEFIYVQHSVITQVPQQVSAISPDPNDNWSQGADDGHQFPVRATSHPDWSDDGLDGSASDQEDSVATSRAGSSSLSVSDDSSSGSAAMAATNAMTQTPQAPAVPNTNLPHSHQSHITQTSVQKFDKTRLLGGLTLVGGLVLLGLGINESLAASNLTPVTYDREGKPMSPDSHYASAGIFTGVSALLLVLGAVIAVKGIRDYWNQ